MLNFILGSAKTGKSSLVLNKISEAARQGRRTMLIVPEQYALEAEKSLYDMLKDELFLNTAVYSFSRLCTELIKRFGGRRMQYAGSAEKAVFMDTAIEDIAESLSFYKKPAGKPGFTSMMLSMADEFKMCGIIPAELSGISEKTANKNLREKIKETAMIAESYNALLSQSYLDMQDDVAYAAELIEQSDMFANTDIYIDEFKGFTVGEIDFIKELFLAADSVTVALCIDKTRVDASKNSVFTATADTYNMLVSAARKAGVVVSAPIHLSENHYSSNQLEHFEKNIFTYEHTPYMGEMGDIKVINCLDEYAEADAAAAYIQALVRENGYRYSDFAVIARNFSEYRNILRASFARYKIPFYCDVLESIADKPIFKAVAAILSIAANGFSNESVFALLKCGLTGYGRERVAELENYCFVWNIKNTAFLKEYKNNPNGYSGIFSESDNEYLDRINEIRHFVLMPVDEFRKGLSGISAKEFSDNLYRLILRLGIDKNAEIEAARLNTNGESEAAAEYLHTWETLMSIINTMAVTVGERNISAKRYEKLFQLATAEEKPAGLPQTVDSVIIGEAEKIRTGNKKVIIALSVNDGVFPAMPQSPQVFTTSERAELQSFDIMLGKSLREQVLEERFIAYRVLTAPMEKLLITSRQTDANGGKYMPSPIVRQVAAMYKDAVIDDVDMGNEFYAKTEDSLFSQYAKSYGENEEFTAAAEAVLCESEKGRQKVAAFERVVAGGSFKISADLAKKIFSERMTISPSKVEDYFDCPFAYFAEHGLAVKPLPQADLDPLSRGTLIHYVLENIVPEIDMTKPFNQKETKKKVDDILNSYLAEVMGGEENKTKKFSFLLKRIGTSLVTILSHIYSEQSQSSFKPIRFECQIGENGEILPLSITTPNNNTVKLIGKIDRVDCYTEEQSGDRYVRVVDYKSAIKQFDFAEAMQGHNLQMLIYLECIDQNTKGDLQGLTPAGVLYMPAYESVAKPLGRDATPEEIEKAKAEKFAMNGLVLNEKSILYAMDKDMSGKYITIKENKSGLNAYSKQHTIGNADLKRAFTRINYMVGKMADNLLEGRINACGAEGTCQYCDYKDSCGIGKEESIVIEKYEKAKTTSEILDVIEAKEAEKQNG